MEAGQNKVTKEDQSKTPLFDAVKRHIEKNIIPFHVPGHKYGRGLKEFTDFVGQKRHANGLKRYGRLRQRK